MRPVQDDGPPAGAVEQTISIAVNSYHPYGVHGAAVDGEGNFWGGCMEDGEGTLSKSKPGGLMAIDTETLTYSDMTGFALSHAGTPSG